MSPVSRLRPCRKVSYGVAAVLGWWRGSVVVAEYRCAPGNQALAPHTQLRSPVGPRTRPGEVVPS